jgi:hypothetical protein
MYLYLIFLTLYFLVKPSCLIILPIVRTGTTKPSFANLQCNFRAQSLVFFLFVITLCLIQIGVSSGLVFGIVALGSKALSPPLLYTATHLSRLLLLCGHTFATSTTRISSLSIGNTHLKRSSLIVFAILIAIFPHSRGKPPYVLAHYLWGLTVCQLFP